MVNESSSSKLSQSKSIKKSNLSSKRTPITNSNTRITKFLFEEVIYCVGDFLLVRETNKTVAVAQLINILPQVLQKNGHVLPMLKVRWFYQKRDITTLT